MLQKKALTQKEATFLLHYACNTKIADFDEDTSILQARIHYKALLLRIEESFLIRLWL